MERCAGAGVSHMHLPAVGLESMEAQIALHKACPELTSLGVGMHPENVDKDWRAKVEAMFARFEDEHPVAVGEVGIDLYHDDSMRLEQMDAFGYQVDRAISLGLPLVIHSRKGLADTLHILEQFGAETPRMVFHSFTSGVEEARQIMERHPEAFFGINGVVTFKNAPELREAVKELGLERIVLETDSPYLAPEPKRGRVNESSYLPYICDKVAGLYGIEPSECEEITDVNACNLLNI